MSEIDFRKLVPADRMMGEDSTETDQLEIQLGRAEKYMQSFSWCPKIIDRYFGFGVGGVIALFLFKLERPIDGLDEWLWVVEGDLPSAYFVPDRASEPASALIVYCELMEEWADAVSEGAPLDDTFPVNIAPTTEHARMLRARTAFIREQVLPTLK